MTHHYHAITQKPSGTMSVFFQRLSTALQRRMRSLSKTQWRVRESVAARDRGQPGLEGLCPADEVGQINGHNSKTKRRATLRLQFRRTTSQ